MTLHSFILTTTAADVAAAASQRSKFRRASTYTIRIHCGGDAPVIDKDHWAHHYRPSPTDPEGES